ncbi:MAG: ABC transporter permease [Oscillospiraceae bacterium]|nr:ABC transporter permease [Oscillospiraceae bacterium]
MNLTAKLAYSQLKVNRRRTFWTLLGVVFSSALITAVFGVAASGITWVERVANTPDTLMYNSIVFGMSVVVNLLVIGMSFVVISNGFRVSAGERTGQFGILKSTGATKKQITRTVVYEGLFLLAIGVPLGIMLGSLFHWSGIYLANDILSGMQGSFVRDISIPFVFSPIAVLLSVALSSLTVLFSAWRPARKAAKIPAIEAIRRTDEFAEAAKNRPHPLRDFFGRLQTAPAGWLFGFEGVLASKSLKRSRRNLRATIVSLAVSMVLFIGAGAFGLQMKNLTELDWMSGVAANIRINNWSSRLDERDPDGGWGSLSYEQALELTENFKRHGDVIMLAEAASSFRAKITPQERTPDAYPLYDDDFTAIETRDKPGYRWVSFVILDDQTYARVSELAGVPIGGNILVNFERQWSDDHLREVRVEPYVFSGQTWELIREIYDGVSGKFSYQSGLSIKLDGVLGLDRVPPEIASQMGDSMVIVPPDSYLFAQNSQSGIGAGFSWFVESENSAEFETTVYELIKPLQDGRHGTFGVYNLQAQRDQEKAIVRVIMTAAYLFIAMLTLIGLTNVISTISTNVRTRAKEFATLESVGMTKSGIVKMLRLESLLCSMRAVLFGIPGGLLLSYITHRIVAEENTWRFDVPWMIVLQCTAGVFVLTWIAMQAASRRLRGGSIVETIRGENG